MAIIITPMVYFEEYFDTIVSTLVFLSVAFSTNSSILFTVESLYIDDTFISNIPPLFILPDNTLSPVDTDTGSDSPVRALVSNIVSPFTTMPSRGTLSPSFTTIISPTFISVVGTTFILLLSFKFDVSSLIFINSATELRLLFTALLSSIFPISYKNITIKPSCVSPSK